MAHNLVYFDSSTNSIQKFSNAQLDDLAERVLRVMAAGTYTGTMSVGTTASIGTFTDTSLVDAAGGTNTTTVSSTYTLSQVATATLGAASDPPMHVGLDTSVPNQTILQENLTTKEQLADEIIARMVASTGGTNAYYLASSAPADGATWVSRGTLLDEITNLTVVVTDYKLWHRTTSGAVLTNRDPVKLSSGFIQNFSTAEIEALIKTIEERIIATGIGTYALQASAPATGTWTNVGTVTDTRENITTSGFTGPATYTNVDSTPYTGTYTGTRQYTGDDVVSYTLTYAGPATYTSPAAFAGFNSFINPDALTFTGPNYLGPSTFTSALTDFNSSTYLGPQTFTGVFTGFDGTAFGTPYTGNYFRTYLGPQDFSATYTGGPFPFSPGTSPTPQGFPPVYAGDRNFTATYTATNAIAYDLSPGYSGPAFDGLPSYTATYVGTRLYTGDDVVSYTVTYQGTRLYTGDDALTYTSTYTGPATYTSPAAFAGFNSFTNPDATGFNTSTYLGPQTFTSAFTDFDGTSYLATVNYEGTGSFTGDRVGSTTSTISTRTLWRRVA